MTVCGIVSCWPNIITRNTSTNKHVNSIESRELDSRNKNGRKSCKLRGYLVRLERLKFKNLMGTLRKMDDDRRNVFILIFNTNLRIFFISIKISTFHQFSPIYEHFLLISIIHFLFYCYLNRIIH